MSLAYLLDTSILVALMRGQGQVARNRFRAADGQIGVSTISVMELEYGAARAHDPVTTRLTLASLLSRVEVVPLVAAAAENAGRLRAELAQSGTPIGPYDALIAGHARSAGLVLVTNNRREFDRVPGLQIEDWLAVSKT